MGKTKVRKGFIIVTVLVTILVILILKGIAVVISDPIVVCRNFVIGGYQTFLMAKVVITEPLKIRSSAKLKKDLIKYLKESCDAEVTQTGPNGWIKMPSIFQKFKIIGKRATPILIEIMKDKTQDEDVRNLIPPLIMSLENGGIEILDKKDKNVVPELIEMVYKGDDNLKGSAAIILGCIKDKRAVEPLIWALKDKNRFIRVESAQALGKIKDKKAIEPLIKALEEEGNYLNKMSVIERIRYGSSKNIMVNAIGEIGGKKAINFLLKELEQNKYGIERRNIRVALGSTKDPSIVRLLLRELRESRCNVDREDIIEAIGHTKDEQVIDILIKIFWTPEEDYVRMSILDALWRIESKKAKKELRRISKEGQDEILRNRASYLLKCRYR